MRLEELINAMLRECMRISANVRDYAIFYWRFCSSRIESQRGSGQDVCCTGTGKPEPVQHRPLLTCGSTASCSARLTVAAATMADSEPAKARRRGKQVEVWVTDEGKAEIDTRVGVVGYIEVDIYAGGCLCCLGFTYLN